MVEPVFGDMKQNRNYRGLLLRGKMRAMGEFLIMCIAHNLRKIARYLMEAGNGPILQPVAT
jgi:transposase